MPAGMYSRPASVLMAKPLPEPAPTLYTHGKPLKLLGTRRNSPEGPVRLKSLHYMNNILAKRELSSDPEAVRLHAEGLMLNADGHVSEGIVSNVFRETERSVRRIRLAACCPALRAGWFWSWPRRREYAARKGFTLGKTCGKRMKSG
ncbi:4-amino-4-deoxychorismate lyase [Paenibacillus sp. P1XP2]|nr:4-amino-4-deoxychorismate lyase [Paenibacillus sp. P1XP2]